jgi:hypothetical protein
LQVASGQKLRPSGKKKQDGSLQNGSKFVRIEKLLRRAVELSGGRMACPDPIE